MDRRTRELIELNDLLKKLETVDLGKLEIEKEEAKSFREKLVEKLEKDPKLGFKELRKKRPRGRPRKHWRTKKKRYRNYYENVIKPQRINRKLELLKSERGWYDYFSFSWKDHGKECLISPEEWAEFVEPRIGPKAIPAVRRYDTSKPISLDNIYIKDTTSNTVVFDGKEHALRREGYLI